MKTYSICPARAVRIFAVLLFVPLLFSCTGQKEDPQDVLIGKWNRTDGNYTLDISEVKAEGELTVAYLNPSPIHVGRSAWRVKEEVLQIYVELQDENYPGSLYKLFYDEKTLTLSGTYFQAVSKQTFDVQFTKVK